MPVALVRKPSGILSQAFLGQLKKQLGFPGPLRQGIGHTGTLDPFAEGLLCVGIEEGTKLLAPLTGLPKTYRVTMALGWSSESFDVTGTLRKVVSFEALRERLALFDFPAFLSTKKGTFSQFPPPQSAARVDGKRAYEWAHAGIEKQPAAREVTVLHAQHESLREATIGEPAEAVWLWTFVVTVSSGTYIRSFARDWGREITGESAVLTRLIRTAIGPLTLPEGQDLSWLALKDLAELFEVECLSEGAANDLRRFGRWDPRPGPSAGPARLPGLLIRESGDAVAWIQSGNRSLGRVFLQDPLCAPSAAPQTF